MGIYQRVVLTTIGLLILLVARVVLIIIISPFDLIEMAIFGRGKKVKVPK